MYEYVKNDEILSQLVKNSVLTEKQLATYMAYQFRKYRTENSEIYTRLGEKVSKGVFHRTLQQARRNIKRSILTIILLGYLDITDVTDVTRDITDLIEVGRQIKNIKDLALGQEINDFDKKKALELLSDILRRLDKAIK
jgi:hypothetical protein